MRLIILICIIVLIVVTCGCTASDVTSTDSKKKESEKTLSPTSDVTSTESKKTLLPKTVVEIPAGGYQSYPIELEKGQRLILHSHVENGPADVMVIYKDYLDQYKNENTSNASYGYAAPYACLTSKKVTNSEDANSFYAPWEGTYYLIIDNTNKPFGGAEAKKTIKATVTVTVE